MAVIATHSLGGVYWFLTNSTPTHASLRGSISVNVTTGDLFYNTDNGTGWGKRNAFSDAEKNTLGFLTATAPADLDQMQLDIAQNATDIATNATAIAGLAGGQDIKDPVDTSTTGLGNITLSGEQSLNGVLTSSSRVLVTDQTLGEENGIYVTAAGAWTRSTDADEDSEVTNGLTTFVLNESSTKYRYRYLLSTSDPITVGTTPLTFVEIPSIDFGATAGTACEGNDSRLPSQDENDALQGTDGSPSNGNRYVTNSDSRNTNERTPVDGSVTNAKLDTAPANTIKARAGSSPGTPDDLLISPGNLVGRLTGGNLKSLTPAEAKTLLSKERGEFYFVGNSTETPLTQNTPVKITGPTYSNGTSSTNMSLSPGRVTYTGTGTIDIKISCTISANNIDGGSPDYIFYVAKNGLLIAKSQIERDIGGSEASITIQCLETMTTNDYIEIFVENVSNNNDIVVISLNCIVSE
jgi:hypothetical protein